MRVEIHVIESSVADEYCIGGVVDANNSVVQDDVKAEMHSGTRMELAPGSYIYGFRVNRKAELKLQAFRVEQAAGAPAPTLTALGEPGKIDATDNLDAQAFGFEVP